MDDIEKKLNQQKADVMKTECPIVIAGENIFSLLLKARRSLQSVHILLI